MRRGIAAPGAGRYLRNVELDIAHNVGIADINEAGDACRIAWGLADGGVPTSEKAAKIHCQALMMNGCSGEFPNTIEDDGLRAIAREFNLTVNEEFLD